MNRLSAIIILHVMAWLVWPGMTPPAGAQETNAPAIDDFRSYALISERNIFNPNRYRRSPDEPPPGQTRSEPEPVQAEFFNLLGIMSYEKGSYGYFNGSHPDFRKSVKVQESIGDHKVVGIDAGNVRLELNGQEVTLKVGMQMKRQNQGEWELVQEPESFSTPMDSGDSPASTDSSGPGTTSTASADTGNEDDDILKRLMQKREQELNNENK